MTGEQPWWETAEFSFIRIPKELFRNPYYGSLSPESKLLYGFLLDRASLSWVSGEKWRTPEGDPFVIFTLEEIQQRLHCADKKATRLLRLLVDHKLIRLSRPKKDGPYHIEVLPFMPSKERLSTCQKDECATVKPAVTHPSKERLNNTENNNTEMNKTDTIRQQAEYEIRKNIDYDILSLELPKDKLDAIVEVMTDTVCSSAKTIWISSEPRDKEAVRERLLAADCMRIRYLFDHMKRYTAPIGSYRAYYLARLWEPEGMVDAFYENWVRRDERSGRF